MSASLARRVGDGRGRHSRWFASSSPSWLLLSEEMETKLSLSEAELRSLQGHLVTAKRDSYNEVLTPEQRFDMDPYNDLGDYVSDDIQGILVFRDITLDGR